MNRIKAVCFGEVLMDIFPNAKKIGGAPLNVAVRLSSLGVETHMISQVGNDSSGKEIVDYLDSMGVDTSDIGRESEFDTGEVQVALNQNGSATYTILHPSAWDAIAFSEDLADKVALADAFIFGSLICRDNRSRQTLLKLLESASFKVLDFNLRPPHYTKEILLELLQAADFVKFNDDELYEIAGLMGSPYHSLEQNMHFVKQQSSASSICVTKGKHGAVLLHQDNFFYNSGYKILVKDTVGAGDSFLASLLAKLLQGVNPQQALDFACAVGALVASKEGANPSLSEDKIHEFMFPQGKVYKESSKE